MGSGGAKEGNKQANQLRQEAQARSAEQYSKGLGRSDWATNKLEQDMWNRYGVGGSAYADTGGGGGGGGGYTPATFQDATMDFWKKLMTEGALSPEEEAIQQSAATSPLSGMFEGLARQMATRAAGGGTGYGASSSKLARDQAYAMSDVSKKAMADILASEASARERGAAGLEDIETKRRAFEAAERARRSAAAGASAARQAASLREQYGMQTGILDRLIGIGDTSLPWAGHEGSAIQMRRDETPMWQKMGSSLLSGAGSAALGAFTGGAGPAVMSAFKKKPSMGLVEDQLAG